MLEREGKNVTLIEMLDEILMTAELASNNDAWLKDTIVASNINVRTGAKLTSVSDNSIFLEHEGQEKRSHVVMLSWL